MPGPWRLLLTGGGTGGHIYPALALAELFLQRHPQSDVLYIGSGRGLEATLVPQAGIAFAAIKAQGVVGKRPLQAIGAAIASAQGFRTAGRLLRRFRPTVALGTGGYVSVPVLLAAARQGVPIIIHEQNALPGVANRRLSRYAAAVAAPFAGMEGFFAKGCRVVVTGNPVRREILTLATSEGRRRLGLEPDGPLVLIFGGSRGAASLNRAALGLVEAIIEGRGIDAQVLWITGEAYAGEVRQALQDKGISLERAKQHGVSILPYLHEMAWALAAADLAVARAGATALAELSARGVPVIAVPSPNVTHDHQTHNARRFVAAGAAVMIEDRALTPERLHREITELLANPEQRRRMAAAGQALGHADAALRLATLIEEVALQGSRTRR